MVLSIGDPAILDHGLNQRENVDSRVRSGILYFHGKNKSKKKYFLGPAHPWQLTSNTQIPGIQDNNT